MRIERTASRGFAALWRPLVLGRFAAAAFESAFVPSSTSSPRNPGREVESVSISSISDKQQALIADAVIQTAWAHLRATDADAALGYYEPDAQVASNGVLYPSFQAFADDVRTFYRTLKEVHLAEWDQMHVHVLSDRVAALSATFRWSSTDTDDVRVDLEGAWMAVFVLRENGWRVAVRHESFFQSPGAR